MKIQAVMAACFGVATIAATGCATSGPAPASPLHASAPAMPTSLSRQQLARSFHRQTAQPVSVKPGADPSFALVHETAELRPDETSGAHAQERRSSKIPLGLALKASSDLPEGWVFVNENMLRNEKSGLECPLMLDLDDENRRFLLQSVMQFDDKGLDVGCALESNDGGAGLTLYASFWPEMSLEESASGAVAAIAQRFTIKSQLSVPVIVIDGDKSDPLFADLEEPAAAGFDVGEINGAPYKTSVWVVKTQGWHVKARATYPQGDETSEVVAAISFAFSHLNVRAKNLAHPVTAGGEV